MMKIYSHLMTHFKNAYTLCVLDLTYPLIFMTFLENIEKKTNTYVHNRIYVKQVRGVPFHFFRHFFLCIF